MEQITVFWVSTIQLLFMLSAFMHVAAGFIQRAWPGVIIFLITSELHLHTL